MRIGELADRSGLSDRALRYYEQIGVLAEPSRTTSGYRDYDEDVLTRIAFVRAAQTAGLTLAEIAGVLDIRERGEAPCAHVEALITTKLEEVDGKINDLEATRDELRSLSRRANELDPADCGEDDICRILNPN
jgi:MerR family copper efflux transcriptional regulator